MHTIIERALRGDCSIAMPEGAKLLGVAVKQGAAILIAEADPKARCSDRYFRIVSAGDDLGEDPTGYVGSITLPGKGNQLSHVVEVGSGEGCRALTVKS